MCCVQIWYCYLRNGWLSLRLCWINRHFATLFSDPLLTSILLKITTKTENIRTANKNFIFHTDIWWHHVTSKQEKQSWRKNPSWWVLEWTLPQFVWLATSRCPNTSNPAVRHVWWLQSAAFTVSATVITAVSSVTFWRKQPRRIHWLWQTTVRLYCLYDAYCNCGIHLQIPSGFHSWKWSLTLAKGGTPSSGGITNLM